MQRFVESLTPFPRHICHLEDRPVCTLESPHSAHNNTWAPPYNREDSSTKLGVEDIRNASNFALREAAIHLQNFLKYLSFDIRTRKHLRALYDEA